MGRKKTLLLQRRIEVQYRRVFLYLSLLGRFLAWRKVMNLREAKDMLRMGANLHMKEVGNELLQFKFLNEFKLQWVMDNGPWNFHNSLLWNIAKKKKKKRASMLIKEVQRALVTEIEYINIILVLLFFDSLIALHGIGADAIAAVALAISTEPTEFGPFFLLIPG